MRGVPRVVPRTGLSAGPKRDAATRREHKQAHGQAAKPCWRRGQQERVRRRVADANRHACKDQERWQSTQPRVQRSRCRDCAEAGSGPRDQPPAVTPLIDEEKSDGAQQATNAECAHGDAERQYEAALTAKHPTAIESVSPPDRGTSPGSVRQAVALAEGQLFLLEDLGAGAEGGGPGGDACELGGGLGRFHRRLQGAEDLQRVVETSEALAVVGGARGGRREGGEALFRRLCLLDHPVETRRVTLRER